MKGIFFFAVMMMMALSAASCSTKSISGEYDLLIKNATIVDGTGEPGYAGHVLVKDGMIKKAGDFGLSEITAGQVIDAAGKVLSPGFIDTHSHGNPLNTPRFDNFLAMGVTTIALGQDGSSLGMDDLNTWVNQVNEQGTGLNIIHFTGHNSLRRYVEAPRESGLNASFISGMQDVLSAALDAGSFGLTTGLEYDHGRFADQAELNALGDVVAEKGGLVISHMRNEDDDAIEESVLELIRQGETSGAAVQASHIKIVYASDPARADAILQLMNEARERGLHITADLYPYTASYTGISILFPDFALPPNDYAEVVSENRERLADYLRDRVDSRNGPGATLFGTAPWAGITLAEAADSLNKPFEDVLIDDIGPGGASAAYFVMDEGVMKRFLSDPYVMVSSDGSPTMRHPRGYGSFSKIIRQFVREEGLLSLEEAIYKMSGLPAETVGLSDSRQVDRPRGLIREGFAADLLLFHPEELTDRATFEDPHQLSKGMDRVFVNGIAVIENGEANSARPGGVVRRNVHK